MSFCVTRLTVRTFSTIAFLATCASAPFGCAADEMPFQLRSRPGFVDSAKTVSVLGLFKDGKLVAAPEEIVGPEPWAFLGRGPCDAAYSTNAVARDPSLTSAIDDSAQAGGISDELLDVLAPAAMGGWIGVVTMSGRLRTANTDAGIEAEPAPSSPPPSMSGRRGGGGRGRRGGGAMTGSPRHRDAEHEGVDLAARFYSVEQHQSVAVGEMHYMGNDFGAAWKAFQTKLAQSLRTASCAGWKADSDIDVRRIRALSAEQ